MATMEPTTLSERLRRARRGCRMSSKELARRLDLTPETLSRYENGRSIPPKVVLYGYAAETGQPLQWIEEGTIIDVVSGGQSSYNPHQLVLSASWN